MTFADYQDIDLRLIPVDPTFSGFIWPPGRLDSLMKEDVEAAVTQHTSSGLL